MAAGLLSVLSCRTQQARTDVALTSDDRTDAEILHDAILATFEQRDIVVGTQNPEDGIVLSEWVELNSELRRRYAIRYLSGRGLILKVIAQFERREYAGPQAVWVEATDQLTMERARREEQDLGGAIQARFKEMRRKS